MFGLFKKKNRNQTDVFGRQGLPISKGEIEFFRKVISSLPDRYRFILPQIDPDFLLGKKVKLVGRQGGFSFMIDAEKERKLRSPNPYVQLKGISVFNLTSNKYDPLEFGILDNILISYYTPNSYEQLDADQIRMENLREQKTADNPFDQIGNIIGKKSLNALKSYINLSNVFELDLQKKKYLTIHDYGDGNYLAIDEAGKIFGLFHDPYIVQEIYPNVDLFLHDLQSEDFCLRKYFSEIMKK
jgi:hypothetical protein